jgi:hypothetical protein
MCWGDRRAIMRSCRRTSTAELDGRGSWLMGMGGIFRYPAVGLFQEGGSWKAGKLGAVADVHGMIAHRRVRDCPDSSVVSNLVVCFQASVTETFFLLDWTDQEPASCRVVSGGMSGVLGAAMLLRCRGLLLADQVTGAG